MTITTSQATAHNAAAATFDALAPLRLPPDLRFTPEQYSFGEGFAYEQVCAEKREAVLELAADGRANIPAQCRSHSSARAIRQSFRRLGCLCQLHRFPPAGWLRAQPDASLVRRERWQALTPMQGAVEIWPAGEAGGTSGPRRIEQAEVLKGGPEFPGLRLELEEIWKD